LPKTGLREPAQTLPNGCCAAAKKQREIKIRDSFRAQCAQMGSVRTSGAIRREMQMPKKTNGMDINAGAGANDGDELQNQVQRR
jgi:hypothetical protein